jgi:hypothetical protein
MWELTLRPRTFRVGVAISCATTFITLTSFFVKTLHSPVKPIGKKVSEYVAECAVAMYSKIHRAFVSSSLPSAKCLDHTEVEPYSMNFND